MDISGDIVAKVMLLTALSCCLALGGCNDGSPQAEEQSRVSLSERAFSSAGTTTEIRHVSISSGFEKKRGFDCDDLFEDQRSKNFSYPGPDFPGENIGGQWLEAKCDGNKKRGVGVVYFWHTAGRLVELSFVYGEDEVLTMQLMRELKPRKMPVSYGETYVRQYLDKETVAYSMLLDSPAPEVETLCYRIRGNRWCTYQKFWGYSSSGDLLFVYAHFRPADISFSKSAAKEALDYDFNLDYTSPDKGSRA